MPNPLPPAPKDIGNYVLVLTRDLSTTQPTDDIRYFVDRPCLDMANHQMMVRFRLTPGNSGTLDDCEYGVNYEVTRCRVN